MKKVLPLLLLLALLGGCAFPLDPAPPPAAAPADQAAVTALLDAQLGELGGLLTPVEYDRALGFMTSLWPIREERLTQGTYEKSEEEERLLSKLNTLYDRYTGKYLAGGDPNSWGYGYPKEETLAEYLVMPSGELSTAVRARAKGNWTVEDYEALWDQVRALLPGGALRDFSRFVVFTDGVDETLAYVDTADAAGKKWILAVDPADAQDGDYFNETVLHEYCHYLTLNSAQAEYTWDQTTNTYNEPGMVMAQGSYLDDFYQEFWTTYLDDRLANLDSYYFFYRHEDDFVDDYASSSPSEDIAESFTYFVLWDAEPDNAVWQQKLNFFYDYPELVSFRAQVRTNLGLEP